MWHEVFLLKPFNPFFGDLSLKTWLSLPTLTLKTPTVMLFRIQRLNESSALWRNWCLGFLKAVSLSVTHGLLESYGMQVTWWWTTTRMSHQAFCQKISQVCSSLAGAPTLQLSLRHRGVLQDHLKEKVLSSVNYPPPILKNQTSVMSSFFGSALSMPGKAAATLLNSCFTL